MKIAVIYQSKYGHTENYAKLLAAELGGDLIIASKAKQVDLKKYEIIVYGGGLYVGSVNGIDFLHKNYESIKDKTVYVFTVGASDVSDKVNTAAIRKRLEEKLPPPLMDIIHLYHLKGGISYSKMSFVHRMMMKIMIKMLSKKPENEQSIGDKDLIANFGKDTDCIDRKNIAPMVEDIMSKVKKSNL